jgi:hypothetical protein
MRFKEIPTRFDFDRYEGNSSLAQSWSPQMRNLDKANYVSEETHKVEVNALPQPIRIGNSYYEKPIGTINRIEQPGVLAKSHSKRRK